MSLNDFPMIERDDGSLVLETPSDPAVAGNMKVGYRRLHVGLDVGGRGEDPSAISIIRSVVRPYLTGRGWEQRLTAPQHTIVHTEVANLNEATDVVDWIATTMGKLKNASLYFDAGGLGAPLVSMFGQAKIAATPVVSVAGSSMRRDGNVVYVAKTLMLEDMASAFESGTLQIAHNLPDRDRLVNEIQSIQYAETSAGNLVLKGGGRGHHADRAIATAIALLGAQRINAQRVTVSKLRGYW